MLITVGVRCGDSSSCSGGESMCESLMSLDPMLFFLKNLLELIKEKVMHFDVRSYPSVTCMPSLAAHADQVETGPLR
jgi:hypothetical protein